MRPRQVPEKKSRKAWPATTPKWPGVLTQSESAREVLPFFGDLRISPINVGSYFPIQRVGYIGKKVGFLAKNANSFKSNSRGWPGFCWLLVFWPPVWLQVVRRLQRCPVKSAKRSGSDSSAWKSHRTSGKSSLLSHRRQETVNSNRESKRLLGYFGELGELLLWFAARALA